VTYSKNMWVFFLGGGGVYSWQYLPSWELCLVYNPTSFYIHIMHVIANTSLIRDRPNFS